MTVEKGLARDFCHTHSEPGATRGKAFRSRSFLLTGRLYHRARISIDSLDFRCR
jgi:hypothetical protein